jgi:hypothetical protein
MSLEVLHHVVAVEELRMDKFFEPTNSWLHFAATTADTLGKRFVSEIKHTEDIKQAEETISSTQKTSQLTPWF